jgi:cobalt/nickel transport system ATP-binding protein
MRPMVQEAAAIALELSAVRHRYPVVDHDTPGPTSFRLKAGERALLVGPNGSGKSTLLRRIVGLLDGPGRISVGDVPVDHRTLREVRRRVGFLWQNPDDAVLLPVVADDVAFGPLNDGCSSDQARDEAMSWLARLGIAHLAPRRVRDLSLGEKQLVSLAGVLARRPGLLLLDEPTSFLDEEARRCLQAIINALSTTMLLVSHEPDSWLDSNAGWFVATRLDGGRAAGDVGISRSAFPSEGATAR